MGKTPNLHGWVLGFCEGFAWHGLYRGDKSGNMPNDRQGYRNAITAHRARGLLGVVCIVLEHRKTGFRVSIYSNCWCFEDNCQILTSHIAHACSNCFIIFAKKMQILLNRCKLCRVCIYRKYIWCLLGENEFQIKRINFCN